MKKRYLVSSLIVLLFCLSGTLVKAEGLGFSVEYQFGGTQIDRSKGFYYILTEPNQEQEIIAKVMSSQEEEVEIKLTSVNAYTQGNGEIGYTDNLKINDKSLVDPITSMVHFSEEVITLKGYETKLVKIKVKAPENHYQGVKAGGILFTQLEEIAATGVGNEFSYRIGLMTAESSEMYNDSKTLKLLEAKAQSKKGKKVISGVLQNPEPKILTGLNMKGTIVEEKTGKIIKEKNVENYKMAPNSNVELDFDWGIEKLSAGKYLMKIEALNSSETWNLSTSFEVTGAQAQKINESSPYQLITPSWLKVVSVILGIATVSVLTMVVLRKKRREVAWKKLSLDKKKKKSRRNKG